MTCHHPIKRLAQVEHMLNEATETIAVQDLIIAWLMHNQNLGTLILPSNQLLAFADEGYFVDNKVDDEGEDSERITLELKQDKESYEAFKTTAALDVASNFSNSKPSANNELRPGGTDAPGTSDGKSDSVRYSYDDKTDSFTNSCEAEREAPGSASTYEIVVPAPDENI